MVSKLGSREIPATTMQFLFTLGSLPMALMLLLVRRSSLSPGIPHPLKASSRPARCI